MEIIDFLRVLFKSIQTNTLFLFLSSVLLPFLLFYSSHNPSFPPLVCLCFFPHIRLIHSSSACKAVEFQLWTRDWNGNKGEQKSRLLSSSTRFASWLEKLGRRVIRKGEGKKGYYLGWYNAGYNTSRIKAPNEGNICILKLLRAHWKRLKNKGH